MNPEDVGRILDEIGERIGPAGEYAWQITVKQVVIDSMVWGIAGVVILIAAIVGATSMSRWNRWYGEQPDFRSENALPYAHWVLFGISTLLWAPLIAFNLTQLLNPEYHAMIRLLERVPR